MRRRRKQELRPFRLSFSLSLALFLFLSHLRRKKEIIGCMSAQFGILSRPMRTLNQSQSLSFTPMSLSTCSCADGMCVRSLLPLNDCVMQRRTNRLGGRRIYFAMTNDEGSSEKMSSHRHEFLLIQSSWVVIFWFLINWTVNSVRSRSSQFCSMLQNDNGNSRLQCFLSVCQTFPLSLSRTSARARFLRLLFSLRVPFNARVVLPLSLSPPLLLRYHTEFKHQSWFPVWSLDDSFFSIEPVNFFFFSLLRRLHSLSPYLSLPFANYSSSGVFACEWMYLVTSAKSVCTRTQRKLTSGPTLRSGCAVH